MAEKDELQALRDLCEIGESLSAKAGHPAEIYQMERGTGIYARNGAKNAEGYLFINELGIESGLKARRAFEKLAQSNPSGDAFAKIEELSAGLGFERAQAKSPGSDWVVMSLPTANQLDQAIALAMTSDGAAKRLEQKSGLN